MNDEQITFDGIPIPLTLETILTCYLYTYNIWKPVRARQRVAFRARILRMFAEKDGEIVILKEGAKYLKETRDKRDARIEHLENDLSQCVQWKDKQIVELVRGVAEYRKEIIEKDEEIRVLEKYIKDHDYKTILDYMEKYLEGDME